MRPHLLSDIIDHMKLMTYNILNGGEDRLRLIIKTISNEKPDFLVINEANGFDKNNNQKLNEFVKKIKIPNFYLSLSGEYDYHTAIFSKYPFIQKMPLKSMRNAGILISIKTGLGDLSIAGIHLTPYAEVLRLKEIESILIQLEKYKNKILMGDMNSLSRNDAYSDDIIKGFNNYQLKKFTTRNKLCFSVVDRITSFDYLDPAYIFNKQKINTVPTKINHDEAHVADMRVDYIFISPSLKDKIKSYSVIKNSLTDRTSDHYPIVVELK